VFLGYASNHKGYMCLSPTGRMYITRHVTFNESGFPYAVLSNPFSSVSSPTNNPSSIPSPTLTVFHQPPVFVSQPAPPESQPTAPASSQEIPDSSATISSHFDSSSTALTPLNPVPQNTHPMLTRAKAALLGPRAFTAAPVLTLPKSTKEALHLPQWSLSSLPPGVQPIGCKWIFKIKYNADGSFQRNKARLVAKGFHQQQGFDYFETFSPVIKPVTIRIILTLALQLNWSVNQIDINNAFLYGDLEESIYMIQPPGFETGDSNIVCKLNKALYGLKQAPRSWFHKLCTTLISLGFHPTKSDTSLFLHFHNNITIFVLIYVITVLTVLYVLTTTLGTINTQSSLYVLYSII